MSSLHEAGPRPKLSFDEVALAMKAYSDHTTPHLYGSFLLERATVNPDIVHDGTMLGSDEVTILKVPTEEEMAALQSDRDEAEQRLRQEIGLPPEIDFATFRNVVDDLVEVRLRIRHKQDAYDEWEKQGRITSEPAPDLSEEIIGRAVDEGAPTVGDFLETVRALSRITGEGYCVFINMCATAETIIEADTDVNELVAKGLAADEEISRAIQENPNLPPEYKELFTLAEIHDAYGIQ